jgi:RNA polymerase sigma-70 factor (ECF subfamily)
MTTGDSPSPSPSPRPGQRYGATSLSLLQRAQACDPEAWNRLIFLYSPLVLHWCKRSGLQKHDAEDVLQEVFAVVSVQLNGFQHAASGSFRAWLRMITRNKLGNHFSRRKTGPRAVGGDDTPDWTERIPQPEPGPDEEGVEERAVYLRALALIKAEFPPTTWQAFWLVCAEDRSPADAAEQLGVSVNVVYLAKSRVLQRLRQEFGDMSP